MGNTRSSVCGNDAKMLITFADSGCRYDGNYQRKPTMKLRSDKVTLGAMNTAARAVAGDRHDK